MLIATAVTFVLAASMPLVYPGVPLRWDRTLADLPEGYTDSLARSVLEHEAGVEPTPWW